MCSRLGQADRARMAKLKIALSENEIQDIISEHVTPNMVEGFFEDYKPNGFSVNAYFPEQFKYFLAITWDSLSDELKTHWPRLLARYLKGLIDKPIASAYNKLSDNHQAYIIKNFETIFYDPEVLNHGAETVFKERFDENCHNIRELYNTQRSLNADLLTMGSAHLPLIKPLIDQIKYLNKQKHFAAGNALQTLVTDLNKHRDEWLNSSTKALAPKSIDVAGDSKEIVDEALRQFIIGQEEIVNTFLNTTCYQDALGRHRGFIIQSIEGFVNGLRLLASTFYLCRVEQPYRVGWIKTSSQSKVDHLLKHGLPSLWKSAGVKRTPEPKAELPQNSTPVLPKKMLSVYPKPRNTKTQIVNKASDNSYNNNLASHNIKQTRHNAKLTAILLGSMHYDPAGVIQMW